MELWSLVASNVPALLCMIVGVILVIVEMVLPGFGIPGITGIVLLILGILVTGGTVGQMLALAGIALVGVGVSGEVTAGVVTLAG